MYWFNLWRFTRASYLENLGMHPRVEVMYVNLYAVDRRSRCARILLYYFGVCLFVCADRLADLVVVNYKFGYRSDDEARTSGF